MGDKTVTGQPESWFATDEMTKCPNCGRTRQITTAGGVTYCFGCEQLTAPLPSPLPPEGMQPADAQA